jgi:hypothetical protein
MKSKCFAAGKSQKSNDFWAGFSTDVEATLDGHTLLRQKAAFVRSTKDLSKLVGKEFDTETLTGLGLKFK